MTLARTPARAALAKSVEHLPGRVSKLAIGLAVTFNQVCRLATARWRVLPHFVIIGAQKAGTTSLYNYLVAHPDIVAAGRKEVHFFDVSYQRGERFYRSMFPTRLTLRYCERRTGRRAITGEASPYYIFHPVVPSRMAKMVPHTKVIVLLRDPVDRAISHYKHEVRAGRETLSLRDALDSETDRLHGEDERLRTTGDAGASYAHQNFSYVARGRYAEQLERWLAHYPRSQILALRAEDLFTEPAATYHRVLEFLGVEPMGEPEFEVYNQGSPGGGNEPGAREALAGRFTDANRRLVALLGEEFQWPSGR